MSKEIGYAVSPALFPLGGSLFFASMSEAGLSSLVNFGAAHDDAELISQVFAHFATPLFLVAGLGIYSILKKG